MLELKPCPPGLFPDTLEDYRPHRQLQCEAQDGESPQEGAERVREENFLRVKKEKQRQLLADGEIYRAR